MRSQLERLRQDYQHFTAKDTSPGLREALKQKIADLENDIQNIERARAASAPQPPGEGESGEGDDMRRAGNRVSRRFPPRFRATTTTPTRT